MEQPQQLGTGHAVKLAKESLPDDGVTLVLYGDVPLISQATLSAREQAAKLGSVGLVVAEFSNPAQLGRIVRNGWGAITEIVEFKDATDEQRNIRKLIPDYCRAYRAHDPLARSCAIKQCATGILFNRRYRYGSPTTSM